MLSFHIREVGHGSTGNIVLVLFVVEAGEQLQFLTGSSDSYGSCFPVDHRQYSTELSAIVIALGSSVRNIVMSG